MIISDCSGARFYSINKIGCQQLQINLEIVIFSYLLL